MKLFSEHQAPNQSALSQSTAPGKSRAVEYESLSGIVSRVTYHNSQTGWSVLRLAPHRNPNQQETVTLFQTKVFAGATMEFHGHWVQHPKFGQQFKAERATEKKPATTASIEKYIGSGLIRGIGPKTARKIVQHFKENTLEIFEEATHRLTEVPGIAEGKLGLIKTAWQDHRHIRDIMMFLQDQGISTLFAVRIYKAYADRAIQIVSDNPYQLAQDFYGIGFFSADAIAAKLGFEPEDQRRIQAGIRHVLSAAREAGHCYLTQQQILEQTQQLLTLNLEDQIDTRLESMLKEKQLALRSLVLTESSNAGNPTTVKAYYANSLYQAENQVAKSIMALKSTFDLNVPRAKNWLARLCEKQQMTLSDDQAKAVLFVAQNQCAILTGGPGVGKTTTTRVIVQLFKAQRKQVLLAAPTGRAAQRMSQVIGQEAKTLHRLLAFKGGQFTHDKQNPLKAEVIILDECSMIDVTLMASFLKAVPAGCQLLLIGDADQLPPVGAGCVLRDLIASKQVPCFKLTQIFRQAKTSKIIRYAHQMNHGEIPNIGTPFKDPGLWHDNTDCLFIDAAQATQAQIRFIQKVKQQLESPLIEADSNEKDLLDSSHWDEKFEIPKAFEHVDLETALKSETDVDILKATLKKLHPYSSIRYGLTALDVLGRLVTQWIPKFHQRDAEIQILTPMTRGSLGATNLNKVMQELVNPQQGPEIKLGERIFRVNDRVIHKRNNYDLNVYNGDIGMVESLDNESMSLVVGLLGDERQVTYQKEDLLDLDLAYAITIHKSQGSEFNTVIIPVLSQHYMMLHKNLIYTGLTRAKKRAVFVGSRQSLAMAIGKQENERRQTALAALLNEKQEPEPG